MCHARKTPKQLYDNNWKTSDLKKSGYESREIKKIVSSQSCKDFSITPNETLTTDNMNHKNSIRSSFKSDSKRLL